MLQTREKKIVAVIPARYASTRFPGKPLADIHGKPMIWWVYQEAKKVAEYDSVLVATESEKVVSACNSYGMNVILTSDNCPSGTDRAAEVAEKLTADLYVVINGDEPLLTTQEHEKMVEIMIGKPDTDAFILTTRFKQPVDVVNPSTVKLALNKDNYVIFMSRAAVPFPKETLGFDYYKHIGLYAFKKETLEFYANTVPGLLEKAEGVEQLRLLENHKKLLAGVIDSESMSVDTHKDLERVRDTIKNRKM